MGEQPTTSHFMQGITRRDFFRLGGAGLAGAALMGTSACGQPSGEGSGDIVFAFGPDDSGTLQPLIDRFNEDYAGRIQVTWREMPRESDDYYRELVSDFEAGAGGVDVIGADVVWTAPLVSRGWVRDLSPWFYDAYDPEAFVEAALNSASYRIRIWGVPWYTDAGVLFYRRDLLEQAGYAAPPATWDELREIARRVVDQTGVQYGFVFQGAEYEGGVANALEYVWNAGGRVLTLNLSVAGAMGQSVVEPNVITVNSAESAQGLQTARSFVEEGLAPAEVMTYRELESWEVFLSGDAVFLRNWPNVYGFLADPARSQIRPAQVGMARIPASSATRTQYSCLGGWNLMVSAQSSSEKQRAAWTFIQYMTAPEQQRYRAVQGGYLPTLQALYEDQEIAQTTPAIARGRQAVMSARVRPISPYYMEMSPRIARAFNRTLQGTITGEEAVETLDRELRNILREERQVG